MTRVSDLIDAHLDYWTVRAQGVPAGQLKIRPVQRPDPRTPGLICVLLPPTNGLAFRPGRVDPSTSWVLAGPLLEKHRFDLLRDFGGEWSVSPPGIDSWFQGGLTPQIAICRAVVRATFGETVPDEVNP